MCYKVLDRIKFLVSIAMMTGPYKGFAALKQGQQSKDKLKVCPFYCTRSSFLYRAGRSSLLAMNGVLPSPLALNAAILLLVSVLCYTDCPAGAIGGSLAQTEAPPSACSTPQVDDDGDGLIEICYIEDLDAVRYQLDGSAYRASASADRLTGGCPSGGCRGYELVRNLDFNSPPKSQFSSYRNLSNQALWTRDLGWLPIGGIFKGVFKGNGFRISNLYIDRGQSGDEQSTKVGLFSQIGEGARIEGLGLEIVAVRGYDQVGALVGENNGEIITSYVVSGTPGSGGLVGVQAMRSIVGGLAALNQTTNAAIVNSYALVDVVTARTAGAKSGSAGGLVGINRDGGEISHSFARGDVSGPCEVGGLVGLNWTSNSLARSVISTSYATGNAMSGVGECDTSANRRGGGLVANNSGDVGSKIEYSYATGGVSFESGSAGTLGGLLATQGADSETVASYWDTESSGLNSSVDGIGATTAALQSPTVPGTTSAEVYYSWSSEAWDFGTASEYPALKYGGGLEVAESACRLVGDATSDLPRCGTFLVPELRYGLQSLTLDTSLISLSPPFNPQRSHYVWQPRGDLSDLAEFILEARVINPASRIRIVKGGIDLADSGNISTTTVSLDSAMGSLWAASASDRVIVEVGTNGTTISYTIESAIGVDVDRDDDGLIEIDWIEDLEAVRYRLDGKGYRDGNSAPTLASGCPLDESGEVACRGYELSRDLDFAAAASYRDAAKRISYTDGVGWSPIGDASTPFSGMFVGNNHRLSHLRMQRRDVDGAWGLFAETSDMAHIDGLALTSLAIDIASHDRSGGGHELLVGALVSRNRGAITNSSAHGDITVRSYFPSFGDSIETGGLVARNVASSARIVNCYALVRSETLIFKLSRLQHQLGGLVAVNRGTIRSSYAIADLSVRDLSTGLANNQANIGGLIALNEGPIRDSYALAIAEMSNLDPARVRRGGLIAEQSTGTITSSYWDAEYSGIASGVGTSLTSVALQSPIAPQSGDAMQAYYLWESADWDFGNSSQYPILKYKAERCATAQAPSYCGHSLAAQGGLLRSLTVSSGSGLSSRFSPAIVEHTIALSADRNTIELRPNAFAADAVLGVRRGTQELADSVSGDSTTISIEQAQTTVTFTVRSANRQSRNYRFVIHRLNSIVDVDADGDGLIEISKLEDLDAVRYQPDGSGYSTMTGSLKLTIGCPQRGCNGYELINDLDFAAAASYRDAANQTSYYADTNGWQPLVFWGVHFDGNGHAIANLKVQTADRGGLFAYLGPGSRLSRIGLLDVEVSGGNETGALVAFASRNSRIGHCHASGRVTGRDEVGGLVGQSREVVSHSRSFVAVTGIFDVGGLVGNAFHITDSHASGDVVGGSFVGGLVGNTRALISNSHASGAVTGNRNVGGLVGYAQDPISNSYASGEVRGSRSIGGLAGLFGAGSLSTIINSYAVGAVSGGTEVGGLVGTTNDFSGGQYRIINCYALGELSGTAAVGGLVGTSRGSFNSENPENSRFPVSISNSYWNTQTSGVANSTGAIQAPEFPNQEGISLSTVQMQSPRVPGTTSTEAYYNWSVADWDFGSSTQYPAVHRSGSSALVARQRASLASLTVRAGEQLWPLDTEQTQHDIEVGFEIERITVVATTATPAIVTVDGVALINGESQAIDLEVLSTRTIIIVLVPQRDTTATRSDIIDNISTRTYIVTVVRQLSVDLRTLSVSSGDLEFALKPDFSRQNSDYTVQVPNRIAELTVAASAVDPKATVELLANGVAIEITADGATKSDEVALVEGGTTTLTVIVISGRTERTVEKPTQMYTIVVSRDPSSDATLRALHVANGVLMPDFDPETSTYTAIVVSASTAVTMLATASNEHAMIEVNGRRVASGSPSSAINLIPDATTSLRIVVTAQDATTRTYTIALSHSFPFIRIRSRLFLEAPLP